ncbi:hypothetical protein SLA2020_390070 [Shorea laevis]
MVGPLGRRRDALTNVSKIALSIIILQQQVDPNTTRSPNASDTTTKSEGLILRIASYGLPIGECPGRRLARACGLVFG